MREAGWKIVVHGWRKQGGRWVVRKSTCRDAAQVRPDAEQITRDSGTLRHVLASATSNLDRQRPPSTEETTSGTCCTIDTTAKV